MNKIFVVAAREFLEVVKTGTFIFSSVFMPLLIVGMVYATQWFSELAKDEEQPVRKIAMIDESGKLGEVLEAQLAAYLEQNPTRPLEFVPATAEETDALIEKIRAGELYAYVRIPADAVDGEGECELARADAQLRIGRMIEDLVSKAVKQIRFTDAGIDPVQIAMLSRPLPFKSIDAKSGDETTGNEVAQFMTPFAFMFLLFMGTMSISQGLLTSLIEEKSSRVIEVLLSAVSPLQLLAGKIVGMVAVGMVLLSIWGVLGYFTAQARDMDYLFTPFRLQQMILYFIPGFLLYSAMLAGIGSVCNSIKDAQSLASPLTILTIVPMMLWWYISENPQSVFSTVISFIPPITPFVMVLRICADPETPLWQLLATQGLLWLSVFVAIWAAAKIFRVGILMYGKPPSLFELVRWLGKA